MSTKLQTLWSVKHVAEYLGMSTSWVYREVEANRLPHLRFAWRLRFDPDDVRNWARQHNKKEP